VAQKVAEGLQPLYGNGENETSTLVRMYDGETIVVGGLIQHAVSTTKRSVPVLGSIPGLGKLFSATYDRDVSRELVHQVHRCPNECVC
jgi:type II secretory pathway component GspD/PulD (secretin)